MKKRFLLICAFAAFFIGGASAVELDSIGRPADYVKSIVGRSQKIVDKLELKNNQKDVLHIIANKYFKLNDIYSKRDSLIKKLKNDSLIQKEIRNEKMLAVQNEKEAALYRSHFGFAADLSLFLTDKQIEQVKDGMTFNVVSVTYNSTLDMIPSLTEEEKAQILAWLKEAREFAVDAESSEKKHEAFGKYKGRINNYLAKRGYDLKKEREGWYARIKEREAATKK